MDLGLSENIERSSAISGAVVLEYLNEKLKSSTWGSETLCNRPRYS